MKFQKSNNLAFLNFLRAKYESWTGEVLVRSYPYVIGLDPSSYCQLRCPLCPTGAENESRESKRPVTFRGRAMLTAELLDALLAELGEYLFHIFFYNWGEPLLNKELPGFIRKAKALNISTEIHSNLSLRLSDQYIEELLGSGIDEIAASVDGFSQESYQTYRRGGDFQLAKSNLERLARTRDQLGLNTNIVWNFLVFSFNEHEIEATREHCNRIGITFNRREAFIDKPEWLPSYRKGTSAPVSPASQTAATAAMNGGKASPCGWHYWYSVVNADGSVSPCCCPWEQEHDFGVIQPGLTSFADVWNNARFRKSRAAFAGKEVKGLHKIRTLCLPCTLGKDVQNLYSFHDAEIRRQFNEVFNGSDPLLARAFELLDDQQAFVHFFRNSFADDLSPICQNASVVDPPLWLRRQANRVYTGLALRYPFLRTVKARITGR
jgi:MoaA/NifB/PqqE/SkfB family radical SAM enzyme